MADTAQNHDSGEIRDLLIEIGCEELPPKALDGLRESLLTGVCNGLTGHSIGFSRERSQAWSTPRRLTLYLSDVATQQPDTEQERRGPALAAAFDDDGQPNRAAQGFAKSVGMQVDDLETLKTEQGEWLYCRMTVEGKPLAGILEEVLLQALRRLPVPRPMRWSDNDFSFIRPVHWLVILHGEDVLPLEILGKQAGRSTRGHRIHSPGPHQLESANSYLKVLRQSRVLVDQEQRREHIRQILQAENTNTLIDPDLLNEVNNLVEWPVAVSCSFDEIFLEVPHQALIASMQDHQKFFPVKATSSATNDAPKNDKPGDELGDEFISNQFVAIANLESIDFTAVREGYERVIRPRLADARFFLEQDQKEPLDSYCKGLDRVIFQEKIGTIGDKSRRIESISRKIADLLGHDSDLAGRAAILAKCDLVTQMVGEFPELQGTMGRHYALSSGETPAVARAIGEHYQPRFSGDAIPVTVTGQIVSIADRLDTLTGIFSTGLKPSGNKDPFALRRAGLGLIRVLLEARLDLSLNRLLAQSANEFSSQVQIEPALLGEIRDFIIQRARHHFQEMGFTVEMINAAINADWETLTDLHARLLALQEFIGSEEGASLAAANKRTGNILRKADFVISKEVDEKRFVFEEERRLFKAIKASELAVIPLLSEGDFSACLVLLAKLRGPVDDFFDQVLVMDEDEAVRRNRLSLLQRLKSLFDQIADFSILA